MVNEENTCERCNKSDTSIGEITQYKNHGIDKLLCQICIKEIDDYYSLTCSKCGKPAHMRGKLMEFENEKICTVCMDEIKMKKITEQDQK
ncbi:hypothetical protein [Nitrosopumilus adriaticus]|uniref:hypothetical protein n=1 Tax=Nitrosopumilus adriaticus TaxID=1580092 RepID=UPI00352D31D7